MPPRLLCTIAAKRQAILNPGVNGTWSLVGWLLLLLLLLALGAACDQKAPTGVPSAVRAARPSAQTGASYSTSATVQPMPSSAPVQRPSAVGSATPASSKAAFPQPRRVLFIGNSFTLGDVAVPDIVEEMARSVGITRLEVALAADGGLSLTDHVRRPATQELLSKPWDVVVLQERSEGPTRLGNITAYQEAAEALAKRALAANPKLSLVLYQTWAYRYPDTWVYPTYLEDASVMQDDLSKNVEATRRLLAERLPLVAPPSVARVGDAFRFLIEQRQPLILHAKDGIHPNQRGKYLAAAVLFATVFGRSAARVSSWQLAEGEAKPLREAAERVR